MRKKISLLFLAACAAAIPGFLFAASPDPDQLDDILDNIVSLADILVQICAVLAIVVFGWGIVKLIAAAGDPTKLKEAKGIITWGVIGMFILASIYGIIRFIEIYTGISSDGPPIEVPTFEKQQ
ncbi:MAG: hypothetical protein U1A23_04380 [Candidatus Sungbacteria bacterium]|nr:hypothetical protein [bacterium]MDZ4286142.1 hypothetical protein [Candidatus Sungbacteria bacterium]